MILTLLLGFCGLALDVGLLELKRLQMQNAADAAAMGAMIEAERGNSDWVAAGRNDAGLNGFTNGSNGVAVIITNSPSTGLYANNGGAYQATITQPTSTLFMSKTITIQAQAVALMPPCGYLMATSNSYATLWLQSASLLATCPVYESQYLAVDYFSSARYDANYVGGSASASAGSSGNIADAIYAFPLMSDPLSYVTSPTFAAPCTFIGLPNITSPTTLSPGTYCNTAGNPGLTISSTVTFNPGLYVITGGLTTNSGATLSGSAVTLYMTKRTDVTVSPTYGQLNMTSTTVSLSAPNDTSSGGVTGVLIFGDRNWVASGADDITVASCTFSGDGIIYFKSAGMYEYNSNIVPPHYFGLVLDNLHEFFGNVHLASNFSHVTGGNPFQPKESLAE